MLIFSLNVLYPFIVKTCSLLPVIKQYNKRSGITYAYESHSDWDPERKMTWTKRRLIGCVGPDTGEIVPTDGRNKNQKLWLRVILTTKSRNNLKPLSVNRMPGSVSWNVNLTGTMRRRSASERPRVQYPYGM